MSKVQQFYDKSAEYEWNRLERHRMEYAVTMRTLADYLPPAPASVLDIGGGPGRYSIALAKQGYRPTLFDLTPKLLAFARAKAAEEGVELADIICGNALHLPFPDASFDAVLLMGPLYHLLQEEDRHQAVREAFRVLKPGGICAAAFIGRYASFRDAAKGYPLWIVENREKAEQIFRTGIHVAGADSGFTDAYFMHPTDVRPLMEASGFASLDLIGVEALVDHSEEQVNLLSGDPWDAWVDLSYQAGKDPCLHGASSHLLWVGRRPAGGDGTAKGWQVDWTKPWFNGSDKLFDVLRPDSTITQWQPLSEAFSHQPTSLWIDDGGRIGHNGRRDGYLYVIDEAITPADLEPVPNSTMDSGLEWKTRRPLRVRMIARLPIA